MSFSEFAYTVLLKPRPLRWAANAFLRAIVPPRIRVHGATVVLNPADPVVSGALALRVYETAEIRYLMRSLRPGMTFVDVGANVGLYTALAIRGGVGRILALEPHPEAFRFLEATVAANRAGAGSVVVEKCAAGSVRGEQTLFSNPENKGDNRLYPDPLLAEKQTVRVETLDELCDRHGIGAIDFLKIDVQGAEMLVLEGARSILSRSPGCCLMTEFWSAGLSRCGSDPAAYLELLESYGFDLAELRGRKLVTLDSDDLLHATSGRHYVNLVGARRARP